MVAPDFDWNSYLADIDFSAGMISRSTCGDISLVTGQSLNLGAEDLVSIGFRRYRQASMQLNERVGQAATFGSMVCAICTPVLAPVGAISTGISLMDSHYKGGVDGVVSDVPSALAGDATTIVLKRSGVPGYAAEKIGNSVGLETSFNE